MTTTTDLRADYESIEEDAARVVLAYLDGDSTELDEAIRALKSNGRHEWWKKYKPIGIRGQDDTE